MPNPTSLFEKQVLKSQSSTSAGEKQISSEPLHPDINTCRCQNTAFFFRKSSITHDRIEKYSKITKMLRRHLNFAGKVFGDGDEHPRFLSGKEDSGQKI